MSHAISATAPLCQANRSAFTPATKSQEGVKTAASVTCSSDITAKSSLMAALRYADRDALVAKLEETKANHPEIYDAAIADFVRANLAGKTKLEGHLSIFDFVGDESLTIGEMLAGSFMVNLGAKTSFGLAYGAGIVMGVKTATWYKPWTWFAVNIDSETIQKARHEKSDSKLFANNLTPAERDAKVNAIWKHSDGKTITLEQLKPYFAEIAAPDASWLDKFQTENEFAAIFEAYGTDKVTRQQLEDFFDNVTFYQLMPPKFVASRLVAIRSEAANPNSGGKKIGAMGTQGALVQP